MIKSSDFGHIIYILGTSLIFGSLFSALLAPPMIVIMVLQIFGWCLYGISFIFMVLIKKKFHIFKKEKGFSRKVKKLIFIICYLAIGLSFFIFPYIGGYNYIDLSFHSVIFSLVATILLFTTIIRPVRRKKPPKKQ